MTDDLTIRVNKLTKDVEKLKNKGKDGWDKFQIIAALLIPASIAVVGFLVSRSLKEAEIISAQKLATGQQAVARIKARVGQANLVKSFMDALLSEEPRKRKLAIEAMLIALPEDGPRLARIISETDPDKEVRLFAKTQQRVESLLNLIDQLPDDALLKLVKNPPVRDEKIERITALRDPNNFRASDPAVARQLLKMMLVLGKRDASSLNAWELGMSRLL